MRSALAVVVVGVLAVFQIALLLPLQTGFAAPNGLAAEGPKVPQNDRLGIAHVTYGAMATDTARYRLAVDAGAGWDRWVAYWHEIERSQGVFDFSRYDASVQANLDNGLQLEIVLMGTPGFYATTTNAQTQAHGQGVTTAASAPRNLDKPVFADGTDVPAPGKAINPDNYWARFVSTTVNRYKGSVRYWEMWNEPDNTTFWWNGDNQELTRYVRLLKVGYLAAKNADPDAQILLGGLMTWQWLHRGGGENPWLSGFINEVIADKDHARYGGYFDILPLHWYARSADAYNRTLAARSLLSEAGLGNKPIWINETNLGVCGDPKLKGKPDCTPGVAKGRLEEQASYIVQAIANAFAAGVDKVFAFQLLDDSLGPFENYGLVRNDGSARPAYSAFQVAASYFRDIKSAVRVAVPPVETVTLVGEDGRVLVVSWNSDAAPVTVAIPARQPQATLVEQTGRATSIKAVSGAYQLTLPGATFNLNGKGMHPDYPVGGLTYVIAEAPKPNAPKSPAVRSTSAEELSNVAPGASAAEPSAAAESASKAPASPTATRAAQPAVPAPTATASPTSGRSTSSTAETTTLKTAAPATKPQLPAAITGKAQPVTTISAASATGAAATVQDVPADGAIPAAVRPTVAPSTEDAGLSVPVSLSTVRFSNVREDGFTVSWVSDAPAIGAVRCGGNGISWLEHSDVRGDVRATVHFVEARNLRPDTNYVCEARAGIETDDDGGSYFGVRTLPRADTVPTRRIAGSVLGEDGRPVLGAIVYGIVPDGRDGPGSVTVAATLTNESGGWQLDLTSAVDDRPIAVVALSSSGLAAERTVRRLTDLDEPLRLAFQWAIYRTATVSLPRGLSDFSLPLVPLNGRTIDDFVREIAGAGGAVADVYWWEGGQWYGGQAAGSNAPFVFGRQYLIRIEKVGNWTLRGLDPRALDLTPPPSAVVRFGIPAAP